MVESILRICKNGIFEFTPSHKCDWAHTFEWQANIRREILIVFLANLWRIREGKSEMNSQIHKNFLEEKVDVAVIEVGIGGLYDCTNIVW